MELKYQMYGIKDENGKYYPVRYSFNSVTLEVRIDAKGYNAIPCPDGAEIINDTDIMTDYFEKDRIKLNPMHKDYIAALNALTSFYEKKADQAYWSREYQTAAPSMLIGRRLAERLASGAIRAEYITSEIANRVVDEKEREHKFNLECSKKFAAEQLAKGNAILVGYWAMIQGNAHMYDFYEKRAFIAYNLVAIDTRTGERCELSGEYASAEEREAAIDKIAGIEA